MANPGQSKFLYGQRQNSCDFSVPFWLPTSLLENLDLENVNHLSHFSTLPLLLQHLATFVRMINQ